MRCAEEHVCHTALRVLGRRRGPPRRPHSSGLGLHVSRELAPHRVAPGVASGSRPPPRGAALEPPDRGDGGPPTPGVAVWAPRPARDQRNPRARGGRGPRAPRLLRGLRSLRTHGMHAPPGPPWCGVAPLGPLRRGHVRLSAPDRPNAASGDAVLGLVPRLTLLHGPATLCRGGEGSGVGLSLWKAQTLKR